MDYRGVRELEMERDNLLARLRTAPNEDSKGEWVLIALRRAYNLGMLEGKYLQGLEQAAERRRRG